MALIAVSGQPGCRFEEVARMTAQRLGFELVTRVRLEGLIEQEFGPGLTIPDFAYPDVLASIVGRLATEYELVLCAEGVEFLHTHFRGMLRVNVVAPEPVRIGQIMIQHRLERAAARQLLRQQDSAEKLTRKRKHGKTGAPVESFDLTLNAEALDSEQMVEVIESCAKALGLRERGLFPAAVEAQLQFQMRLRLAKYGIVPPGRARLAHKCFAHESEQIFANLLDFYRIAWEYEPRSFPIQWDGEGKVTEAFTPDFYLSEFDLYVELTTMKQSLVTKKNRKVRLLRELYPRLNIQVFYQKDIANLIFKYGLAGRTVEA